MGSRGIPVPMGAKSYLVLKMRIESVLESTGSFMKSMMGFW